MKSAKQIRKELAILRNNLIISGINSNKALTLARQAMNNKYGKGWREQTTNNHLSNYSNDSIYPSIYDGHENGEYWMD